MDTYRGPLDWLLVSLTAADIKRYPLIDVPENQAWAVAAQALPWMADSGWAAR